MSQTSSSLAKKKDGEDGKKKISFIEQANKRKECDKLAAYIMSIDLMLNSVLHQLVVNSMTTIQDSISQRLAGAEEAKQKAKSGKKKKVQVGPAELPRVSQRLPTGWARRVQPRWTTGPFCYRGGRLFFRYDRSNKLISECTVHLKN